MSDLRELYQEVILDHTKHPRNFGALPHPTHRASGRNPLCGDQLVLTLEVAADRVRDARFAGKGCAISTASASLLTEAVKGKTTAEAHELFARFHRAVTAPAGDEPDSAGLGKLAALAGVREFPTRVKCASLAWHTLEAALAGASEPVSTE
ncbi:MAG TPA: SUF system NifU family Fe-S cluster assembly protein [Myxococcota bacterium]|nr:SUF system NifU family Fe-S cluster assembly protein [Myxococcota bacterium]